MRGYTKPIPCYSNRSVIIKTIRLGKKRRAISIQEIFKKLIYKKIDKISHDDARVITRTFIPRSEEHIKNIINRVLSLDETKVSLNLSVVFDDFSFRHKNIEEIFIRNFNKLNEYITNPDSLSLERKLLIGSYFTMEYSVESASLFNPSVVLAPNQAGLKKDEKRVIFSFRATGEGHISSIVFRSAVIDKNNEILMDPVNRTVTAPNIVSNPVYDKALFEGKLKEMGFSNESTKVVFSRLKGMFSFNEMRDAILEIKNENISAQIEKEEAIDRINWLAKCNYEAEFPPESLISERILFPGSQSESHGMEDARFVRFMDDNGEITYYATYTAYNGLTILPQLIETKDFRYFRMITLNGAIVQNKGMALFPKKINSKYAMISRVDGENLYLMYSDNLHFWNKAQMIKQPEKPWEFVQIGNCGSPLETERGWILLTHGVGPVRKYCIGALLLDLKDPARVIGRLDEPFIAPNEKEREGYVPNVVYSCGSIILNNELIIPYATSDSVSHIALISVEELLNKMTVV